MCGLHLRRGARQLIKIYRLLIDSRAREKVFGRKEKLRWGLSWGRGAGEGEKFYLTETVTSRRLGRRLQGHVFLP